MNGDQVNEHAKEVAKELNVTDHRAHPSDQEVYLTRQKSAQVRVRAALGWVPPWQGSYIDNPWTRSGRSPGASSRGPSDYKKRLSQKLVVNSLV